MQRRAEFVMRVQKNEDSSKTLCGIEKNEYLCRLKNKIKNYK
jgi:hypothetical protein